jgi:hypothetical protein
MAHVKRHGTGITARDVEYADNPDEVKRAIKSWAQRWQDERPDFESCMGRENEAIARAVLEDHGIDPDQRGTGMNDAGYGEHSPPWYASQILTFLSAARKFADNGDVGQSMRYAYKVGALASEANIKFEWESYALESKTRIDRLHEARDHHNTTLHEQSKAHWQEYRQEAADLYAQHGSKKRAAELLKRRHDLRESVDTIRKRAFD